MLSSGVDQKLEVELSREIESPTELRDDWVEVA
jgi:hypothetical protein